jgi:hypothetical protein
MLRTAAHCVVGSGQTSFTLKGVKYSGPCTYDKNYATNPKADHAFCFLDKVVPAIEYENFNTDPTLVKVGDKVLLSGYGCTKQGGPIDGKLRVGYAEVISFQGNDIQTGKGAILCPGDSGGPLWKILPDGSRIIVGDNSRTNWRQSFHPSTSTKDSIRFTYAAMAKF